MASRPHTDGEATRFEGLRPLASREAERDDRCSGSGRLEHQHHLVADVRFGYLTQDPTVEVIDCGPGVAPDKRDQIFERFWKGDRNGKGAGLGLAIVKHIMTALQGSVSISDNPGGGAAFTLRFPPSPQHS